MFFFYYYYQKLDSRKDEITETIVKILLHKKKFVLGVFDMACLGSRLKVKNYLKSVFRQSEDKCAKSSYLFNFSFICAVGRCDLHLALLVSVFQLARNGDWRWKSGDVRGSASNNGKNCRVLPVRRMFMAVIVTDC